LKTFQVNRKNEVAKCNKLDIRQKLVAKHNIKGKQKSQAVKHGYVQIGSE